MKIKVPDNCGETGALSKEEEMGMAISRPVSAPSSPTSVTGDVVEGSPDNDSSSAKGRSRRKRPLPGTQKRRPGIARLVSQDFTSCLNAQRQGTPCISSAGEEDDESMEDISERADSPNTVSDDGEAVKKSPRAYSRRVSVLEGSNHRRDSEDTDMETDDSSIPRLPNPLHCGALHDAHVRSLRLERELAPMRHILFKLMSNLTYNRRGLFNVPVDPVALGLSDYTQIVTKPMDLGTVKARLHALAYKSREEVAEDIRLVFCNAIIYNPQEQFVHIAARRLLDMFEALYLEKRPAGEAKKSASVVNVSGPVVSPPTTASPPIPSSTMTGSGTSLLPTLPVPTTSPSVATPPVASIATRRQTDSTAKPVHMSGISYARMPSKLKANRKKPAAHYCTSCLGRTCAMCNEGCITHEPTLLICNGLSCGCAKIRKGAVYFISNDGTRQYCQKCYTGLSAVLPQSGDQHDSYGSSVRYKRDLLKRKNDEEIAERWLTCSMCQRGVHQVCAMYNEYAHSLQDFVCPTCIHSSTKGVPESVRGRGSPSSEDGLYSFVSGSAMPVSMEELPDSSVLSAEKLEETPVSAFIQRKVRERMVVPDCPNADRTVSVRIISDCEKSFSVPEVVRKHFRVAANSSESHLGATALPPTEVNYKSIAIALFQKIDGVDVCIFCMYVQEYDGDDEYDDDQPVPEEGQGRRVYIAYLDSVEHFRPRSCRTEVYHEMLVAYLATARARGYETAHIWACPPTRGNSFVFWNHPSSQRTPSRERLVAWYHGALSRAVDCGVVTDVKSMYESAFQDFMSMVADEEQGRSAREDEQPGRMVCPPLLDGDFWIEEAQRIHTASILRYLKSKSGVKDTRCEESAPDQADSDVCPALQVASLLRNRVMALPNGAPFRRPVNAAAMNLKDYHRIITKPMDLGTVYSRCVLGEYECLRDLVAAVELVFANAMQFNPPGHVVHAMAVEMQNVFFQELNGLTRQWDSLLEPDLRDEDCPSWSQHVDMSMSLDKRIVVVSKPDVAAADEPSVVSTNDPSSESRETANSQNPSTESATEQSPSGDSSTMSLPPDSSSAAAASVKTDVSNSKVTQTSSAATSVAQSLAGSKGACTADARRRKPKPPPKRLDLLTDGPDAVHQRMVGDDVWMLDKRNPMPPKSSLNAKKNGKRKKSGKEAQDEAPSKRRRQSWLGEEVGVSMRKIRTSFFTCSLLPKTAPTDEEKSKLGAFDSYCSSFAELAQDHGDSQVASSRIADARHALLEFSQYRNFEFDTLRRAKYSTAMLLYHLHNDDAPGLVPSCTSCSDKIEHVRWHQIRKRNTRQAPSSEELCSQCHSTRSDGDKFIPLPVSFRN